MTIPRAQAYMCTHLEVTVVEFEGVGSPGPVVMEQAIVGGWWRWLVEVMVCEIMAVPTGGGYSVYVGMMYSIVCSRVWYMVSCGRVGGKQRRS